MSAFDPLQTLERCPTARAIPDFGGRDFQRGGTAMRRAHHLAALPILLLCSQSVAAGPHPPNINITWDQNIKFGKYHSYIWVPGRTRPAGENVADYERVRASIDRYL